MSANQRDLSGAAGLGRGNSSSSDDDQYLTSSRWVHEETPEYYEDQGRKRKERLARLQPRDANADSAGSAAPLAQFLNDYSRADIETTQPSKRPAGVHASPHKPIMVADHAAEAGNTIHHHHHTHVPKPPGDGKEIVCGPLLNYRRMEGNRWYGSVLYVTHGGGERMVQLQDHALLELKRIPLRSGQSGGANKNGEASATNGAANAAKAGWNTLTEMQATANILYSDPRNTFWQFNIQVPIDPELESRWEYFVDGLRFPADAAKPAKNSFFVPSLKESMRILFFSCNGFSVGTDEEAWSGPALWNDVMRQQNSEAPFHVMLGGGDQIYNDGIRVSGPLRDWTDIANPKKRKYHPYPESMRQSCDDWYLQNYISWYNTDPFATANGQIAQINVWDDHDIIDGFGSYVDDFMMCDVFRGIGGTAHKYYMLFQHHLAPPATSYVTDELPGPHGPEGNIPTKPVDTYVGNHRIDEGYIIGSKPGPYVTERSYNIFAKLGARIALTGVDARTERTRHQVNYPETYDAIFDRLSHELGAARDSGTPFRHLILLLGIPVAYPRLTWLENVFSSPFIAPIKFLNKRFGVGGSIFNKFDGNVDLLDDLDDHYTAKTHKKERNELVERLQGLAEKFSVRITMLGGDVHLAALGRFYSNPDLGIPTEKDARYMANVVSSAIVNKPPPAAVANLLARRNKIHHLNPETDETLLDMFNKDPTDLCRTAAWNNVTMPSRNFAMITENSPNNDSAPGNGVHPAVEAGESRNGDINGEADKKSEFGGKDGDSPLHAGEVKAGTYHTAATDRHGRGCDGSLDICIRVEKDQHDPTGQTEGYGVCVPALDFDPTFVVLPEPKSRRGWTTSKASPRNHIQG